MKRDEFLTTVQRRASLDETDEARAATDAVLATLGERITENEAEDLAAQLPRDVADAVTRDHESAESMSPDEFVDRVEQRTDDEQSLGDDDGERYARAVLSTVDEAVTEGEAGDVRAQLPEEFGSLFEAEGAAAGQS